MNDPFIVAVADRIRSVVAGESASVLATLAGTLYISSNEFRTLIEDRESTIDVALLIDTVAALVREFAIDPQWLLTGVYDTGIHRQALMLADDRSVGGTRAIQDLVRQLFARLRHNTAILTLSDDATTE